MHTGYHDARARSIKIHQYDVESGWNEKDVVSLLLL